MDLKICNLVCGMISSSSAYGGKMLTNATTLSGPRAEARIRSLGLESEWLVQAAETWYMERENTSSLEPSVSPGFKGWVAAFRVLAEHLLPLGYEKLDHRCVPRLVHPDSRLAFAVCTGDDRTGIFEFGETGPKSANRRGPMARLLVRSNKWQLSLFDDDSLVRAPIPADEEQITRWLLLYEVEGAIRAELSLPVRLDDCDRLSDWEERIKIDMGDRTAFDEHGNESDDEIEIDVDVTPRS